MLSEDCHILLLLYLIILHSINSTKCTKYIYAPDLKQHMTNISVNLNQYTVSQSH